MNFLRTLLNVGSVTMLLMMVIIIVMSLENLEVQHIEIVTLKLNEIADSYHISQTKKIWSAYHVWVLALILSYVLLIASNF